MWICNWLALLYLSLFPDIDLKEKISMVENGTKLEINIFALTVQQEKKGACADRAAIVTFASHYAANLRGLE